MNKLKIEKVDFIIIIIIVSKLYEEKDYSSYNYHILQHYCDLCNFMFFSPFFQGVIATIFIKANLYWCRYRKVSRLGQYPVTEVLVVTAITAVVGYLNRFTRMSTSQLIFLLFSQCGVTDSYGLWYVHSCSTVSTT